MTYSKSLDDVPGEKAFWFCNGTRALNLYQLVDTVEHTSDEVFDYHVSGAKNDFAVWVRDVLEDQQLYDLIWHERSKYWFVQKVRRHLKEREEQAEAAVS